MSSYAKVVDGVYSEFKRNKSKSEVMEWLKQRYEDGFRYVVRDLGSDWLSIYSMKPKSYWRNGLTFETSQKPTDLEMIIDCLFERKIQIFYHEGRNHDQ